MEQTYTIAIDLPQFLYNEIVILANSRGQTINQVIIETLQTALQSSWDNCEYPDCPPDSPPDWESRHFRR